LPVSIDPAARLRKNFSMAAPHPIFILPFALLLGAIAVAPLVAQKWWLRYYAKIALGLGAVTLAYYIFGLRDVTTLAHTTHEYISFIALVGSLYVVSGGIHIGVKGEATPFKNVVFLFIGAVIANLLGTTGAAMLLIRPWIRMNQHRVTAHLIVFFIFIVANVGGCLTPIGDPPLFLGYLQGIPFWWVAEHCWPMWAVGIGLLLAMFYVVDKINFARVPVTVREMETATGSWRFDGLANLFFLAVILGAVFVNQPVFLREILMVAAAAGSYFTTKKTVHVANQFDFHPILEVVILFGGIFSTMMPALGWLNQNAPRLLGEHPAPGVFFWGTGVLSSALDNAPTYLGFLSALFGVAGTGDIPELLGQQHLQVLAISVGAVFFGAATYIGNGPNFMVKAIAEQQKVSTPGFFGFIFKFALPFLLPVLIIVWLLFFHG
jgi:Na+/H+ antiporter NhaD/arsenite permease-like protein